MHRYLANDEEFPSLKLLKFKYRRGDQILEAFLQNWLPQKIGLPGIEKFQYSEKNTPE